MEPITRKEKFMAKAGGQNVKTPEPITREEKFLAQIRGGGGVSSWNDLTDKPFYEETGGVVLPEAAWQFNAEQGTFFTTHEFTVEPGKQYTVKHNGTEYNTLCQEWYEGFLLGNFSLLEAGDDTGEPFVMIVTYPELVEAIGGIYAMAIDVSGATEFVVSIVGDVLKKLDPKFVPRTISLANGVSPYSVRTTGAEKESEDYSLGAFAFAEGRATRASGEDSHAEGGVTTASGEASHAEGSATWATGDYSHAEGSGSRATASDSHAEGSNCHATGIDSHAEGHATVASGQHSHAEGNETRASGIASHAEGTCTIASAAYSHVQGRYNVEDTEKKYAHIVGNGYNTKRSNAHTIDWDGNAWFAGTVEGTAIILASPNGTRYKITVDDNGTISATAV